jgi:hypothetical protein
MVLRMDVAEGDDLGFGLIEEVLQDLGATTAEADDADGDAFARSATGEAEGAGGDD